MKIKICGLTDVKEAEYLNKNYVDFAGMVLFYPKSKRNISIPNAKRIMEALDERVKTVAVVVNPTIEQGKTIEAAGFDYIQIHGEIPDNFLAVVRIPVLKAFHANDIENYEKYHNNTGIAGYVFDAQEPGSGKTFDWSLIKSIPRDRKLLFLAGGLCPANIEEAINCVAPDGVDVSSGVEYTYCMGKDPEKIQKFVENVRKAE